MKAGWISVVVASVLSFSAASRADDIGTEIDLTTFGDVPAAPKSVWSEVPVEDVALRGDRADRRFYVSGMLGPSFATLSTPAFNTDDTLLAAGGAVGMAFERRNGRLRVETEGMGRSDYFGPMGTIGPVTVGNVAAANWSVMENIWRDLMVTDRFGAYGGGGLGAGGYRFGLGTSEGADVYASPGSAFAWQFGGGLIYEITDRLTFDVGYRYFHIDSVASAFDAGPTAATTFAASELMFGLRLYEPFRRWTR